MKPPWATFALFYNLSQSVCLTGKSCELAVGHKFKEHSARTRELGDVSLPIGDAVGKWIAVASLPVEYVQMLDVGLCFFEIDNVFINGLFTEGLPIHSEFIRIDVLHQHQGVVNALGKGLLVTLETELHSLALGNLGRAESCVHKFLDFGD